MKFRSPLTSLGLLMFAVSALHGQAAKRPVMTPEQRAREQARLNAEAAELDAAMPLEANKENLRRDVTPLRDTLIEVSTVITRLTRAHATNTASVATSSAKQLRLDCAGAANVGIALQPKVAGLKTADARANGFLNAYRAALADLIRTLQTCDKNLGTLLGASTPNQSRLNDVALTTQAAIAHFTESQRNLFDLLQIRMLPRGYKPVQP